MLSAGMFTSLASAIALRSLGLPSASPPPMRAAIVISLMSFVNMRPRLASMAPFLCLILCHLEWPDIVTPYKCAQFGVQFSTTCSSRGDRWMWSLATSWFPLFDVVVDPLQDQVGELQVVFVLHQHVAVAANAEFGQVHHFR